MPLTNDASISDIIKSLSNIKGINQKVELASVIGEPATANDNITTQIVKLQDAKNILAEKTGLLNTMPIQSMADNLVVGKKWASGTTLSSYSNSYKPYSGTGQAMMFNLVVNDLAFKPSTIIAFLKGAPNEKTIYDSRSIGTYDNRITVISGNLINGGVNASSTTTIYSFRADGVAVEGSFTLPVEKGGQEYDWIAYE